MTIERLKELLHYDEVSGIFTWLESRGRVSKGTEASAKDLDGYTIIRIDGTSYKAHRLAILFMTGKLPEGVVDHKDQDPGNNSYSNLRDTTCGVNSKNQKLYTNNTSGHVGVYWHKRDSKWKAQIKGGGKVINLGTYNTKEEAILAREEASLKYGFYHNHGKES